MTLTKSDHDHSRPPEPAAIAQNTIRDSRPQQAPQLLLLLPNRFLLRPDHSDHTRPDPRISIKHTAPSHRRTSLISGPLCLILLFILLTSLATSCGSQHTFYSSPTAAQPLEISVAGPTQLQPGESATYVATSNGSPTTSVIWAVNGVTDGNNEVGTITSNGVYLAPLVPQSVTISATALAPSASVSSVKVDVLNPQPSITTATLSILDSSALAVNLIGTGFVQDSSVSIDGQTVPTTFLSTTTLQIALPQPTNAASHITLIVSNTDPPPTQL